MFLIVETRPDVAIATSVFSGFAKNSGQQHMEVVKTILKYLKESRDRRIMYDGLNQDDPLVEGYSNSDWEGNKKS